ncbi:methylmalonyl-CoA mutase family protein, partial [Chloroflexota bacterium]
MLTEEERKKIENAKKEWEAGPLKESLDRFGLKENPERHYSPLDLSDHDFVKKVGFPGSYPYTGGEFAIQPPSVDPNRGDYSGGVVRQPWYSGYGTAEDTRDFYLDMRSRGWQGGPNIAYSLSTQCGYDSDHPMARGEVGKAGVTIDTLRDVEVLYEAFTGPTDLDKIVTNGTINPLACIYLAMYVALAKKRGIPLNKLRGTLQHDNLKEVLGRGTCVFPVRPQMRITRDYFTYCNEHLPRFNMISILGYHIREAGASGVQTTAYTLANAMEYVRIG